MIKSVLWALYHIAYVDGYNDCFEQFKGCLKDRKSLMDALRKMEIHKAIVNGVVCDEQTEGAEQE